MYDIYGTRVTPAGAVLDASGIAVDAGGTQRRTYQSIAYTGSEYLIAWSDYAYLNAGSVGIRLARMTPAGSITTPAGGLAISGAPPSQPPGIYAYTSVAAGATECGGEFRQYLRHGDATWHAEMDFDQLARGARCCFALPREPHGS